eukprot:g63498.t1
MRTVPPIKGSDRKWMKAKEFSLLIVTCDDDAILRVLYMRRDRFRSIRAELTSLGECKTEISVTIIHSMPVIPWSPLQSYCIFLHIVE